MNYELKGASAYISENTEVSDMLLKIEDYIYRLNYFESRPFNKTSNLNIGGNTIGIRCLIHFLSGNPSYYRSSSGECSETIAKYVENGKLSLKSMIKLSDDNYSNLTSESQKNKGESIAFLKDAIFYENLYAFDLSLVTFIANDPSFRQLPTADQYRLLDNVRIFIKQSLQYLTAFMKRYSVTDNKLIAGSYDLMYILSNLYFRQANTGTSIEDLRKYHNTLVEAVTKNIDTFVKIEDAATSNISQDASISNPADISTAKRLAASISTLLPKIQEQSKILDSNLSNVVANNNDISGLASNTAKAVVEKLGRQL